MIRLLLADERPLLHLAWKTACTKEQNIDLVNITTTAAELYCHRIELRPDVALVHDQVLLATDGDAGQSSVAHGNTRLIIVGRCDNFSCVSRWLHLGINGYMEETETITNAFNGIRIVAANVGPWISPQALQLFGLVANQSSALTMLTKRETDVMKLVAQGYDNAAIAAILGLEIGTVKNHISNSYPKLEVSSRAEAVALLWRAGWGEK